MDSHLSVPRLSIAAIMAPSGGDACELYGTLGRRLFAMSRRQILNALNLFGETHRRVRATCNGDHQFINICQCSS